MLLAVKPVVYTGSPTMGQGHIVSVDVTASEVVKPQSRCVTTSLTRVIDLKGNGRANFYPDSIGDQKSKNVLLKYPYVTRDAGIAR